MDEASRFVRIIFVLLLGILLPLQNLATWVGRISPSNIEFMLNTQKQSLNWSIAGNASGKNPNILSELVWEQLGSIGIDLKPVWLLDNNISISTPVSFSRVVCGTVSDSDYEGDNRASRVFFYQTSVSEGYSYHFFPNIGYRLRLLNPLEIRVQVGYVSAAQKFYLKDDQLMENGVPLNSTYQTYWQGPGFSVETSIQLLHNISAGFGIHYYQVHYRAKADWNLLKSVAHPVSFTHQAKGYGLEFDFQLRRELNERIQLLFNTGSSHWCTGLGIDRLYKSDGTVLQTRLNKVVYHDLVTRIGISVSF